MDGGSVMRRLAQRLLAFCAELLTPPEYAIRWRRRPFNTSAPPATSQNWLAPVPFDQHPSAMAVHPMVPHPNRIRPRRTIPPARHPYVACAIPAVITTDPDVSTARRRTVVFHNRGRRPDANVDLPVRSSRKQYACQQHRKRNLLHNDSVLRNSKLHPESRKFRHLCDWNAKTGDKLRQKARSQA